MANQWQVTSDGVPISDGFDFPLGPRGAVNVFETQKVDVKLNDPNYQKLRNAWHPGEDWNGIRGGNTDLGDPVYAISHGKVAEFADFQSWWGKIILLEHALPDGSRVWSQYAHLGEMLVQRIGQQVRRGQKIGTIGLGGPKADWPAHLHFEIRRNRLAADSWRPIVNDENDVLANYHYPTKFIQEHRPGTGIFATDQPRTPIIREPLHLIVDSGQVDKTKGVFQRSSRGQWFTGQGGYYGSMFWTPNSATGEATWGEWRPFLPQEDEWQLWVFIPAQNGATTSARYEINHLNGKIVVELDQSKYVNQWAFLGFYSFAPGRGYVRLTNTTGESGQAGTRVVFDAMSWTLSGG